MPNVTRTRLALLLIACAGALYYPGTSTATMQAREQAHELKLAQILRWPLRAGDSLVYRRCEACATETLRLTSASKFATAFDGSSVSLADLLRIKTGVRRNQVHVVTVFYLPESREVTRLILQTEF